MSSSVHGFRLRRAREDEIRLQEHTDAEDGNFQSRTKQEMGFLDGSAEMTGG